MGPFDGSRWGDEGGWGGEDGFPGENRPGPDDEPADPVERVLGGDFPEYGAYIGAERARAGELALELLKSKDALARLQEQLRHKESEVWQQGQVIAGLKAELRGVGATMAALQEQITALRAAAGMRETAPPPAAPADDTAALHAALADLETRLQDAVVLVLDEMNTRRAAEARVDTLEARLRAVGAPVPPPGQA